MQLVRADSEENGVVDSTKNTNTCWLNGRPKRKRPLERPRHREEDNVNMDLEEVGCEGMDWTDLAQDRNKLRAFVKNFVGTQKQDDGNGCLLQPASCTKKQRRGGGDKISCAKKTGVLLYLSQKNPDKTRVEPRFCQHEQVLDGINDKETDSFRYSINEISSARICFKTW